MKSKEIKTIVQPMYKVFISSPAKSGWFYCNADSEEKAIQLAKQTYPTYKIGEGFECLENWSISWN